MRIRLVGLLALVIAIAPCPLAARVVGDLYRAETIVTGTVEPERTRGFREAFEAIIVKLTGRADLVRDPRVVELTKSPHPFVRAFEYEDRMKDIPVHDEQGTRERPHFLRVTFSKEAIDAALQRLGIAPWQPDRPVVAVWLAIETPAGQFVLTDAGPAGYGQRAVITETASRLGLPIELPHQGRNEINVDDIAHERRAALGAAAPDADAHLVGRLTARSDGYWDIAWSFHAAQATHHWSLAGVTFDQGLKHGLVTAVEVLSGAAGK